MGRGRKGRKVQGEEYLTFIIYEVNNLLFHKSYKKNPPGTKKCFCYHENDYLNLMSMG